MASRFDYSLPNIRTVLQVTSPQYFVTGQTQLLLAEAIVRVGQQGSADVFETALRANLEQLSEYGPNAAIEQADIDTFVSANPLNVARN